MPCTVIVAASRSARPPLLSHSFDTAGGVDYRCIKVPPNPNPPNPRPIYRWDENAVPRFFGVGRGPISEYCSPLTNESPTESPEPIGHIPQTDRAEGTFGYWEAASGIANEKGVMIGECTCSAVFGAAISSRPHCNYDPRRSGKSIERVC